MSLDFEMNGIFPTPIYFAKLKKFTDMELRVIKLIGENQTVRNMGNSRSEDTFILKSKPFENIRKQLMQHIRQYFNKVICTYDKQSKSGSGSDASKRKVKGTLHLVSQKHAIKVKVNLYR